MSLKSLAAKLLEELEPSCLHKFTPPIHRVVTSQNLWSRYDRHFVGTTWHNVRNLGEKIYRVVQILTESI